MTRLTIEISDSQKKHMKMLAASRSLTLKDLILDSTIGLEPNAETMKSFDDYKKKRNLTKHDDFGSFLEDLND